MQVASADVRLSASHFSEKVYSRQETLRTGHVSNVDGSLKSGQAVSRIQEQANPFREGTDLLDLFQGGRDVAARHDVAVENLVASESAASARPSLLEMVSARVKEMVGTTGLVDPLEALRMTPQDQARMDMIAAVLERFTGKRIQLMDPEAFLEAREQSVADANELAVALTEAQTSVEGVSTETFGIDYQLVESYRESESTTFEVGGQVQTADGQSISVDVSVTMSRSFAIEQRVSYSEGANVQDPLVINFKGTAAELTERSFSFDIDADGQIDQIATPTSGGFLALDRNGDGTINDGSELFGPTTGNGFDELAAYDEDGNGFVDSGDSVFDQLRIFVRHEQSTELVALGQRGVGAIYTGSAPTPFEIKNDENELLGIVKESGIYIGENGNAGTIQQVDLVA